MYVESIKISQLRCFANTELQFLHPDQPDAAAVYPNINLLLGNNGAGKTTALKAVAIAALAPLLPSSGFIPYRLVRKTSQEVSDTARIVIRVAMHQQDSEFAQEILHPSFHVNLRRISDVERIDQVGSDPNVASSSNEDTGISDTDEAVESHGQSYIGGSQTVERMITSGGPANVDDDLRARLFIDRSPAFLVVGYGASRRVESARTWDAGARRRTRQIRYERVAGLFEEQLTLTPLESWLPQLSTTNPKLHKEVISLIDQLLPPECRFTGEFEVDEYVYRLRDVAVPFGALSDGYRAYVGWVVDLLYHMTFGEPDGALAQISGIVMVDEIDLHLHPEWQRTVVPRLAAALPRLQFILTTHSPIVAGTVESRNIHLLEADEGGASVARQLHERIHGLNADQILLSSYFNLETTRADTMEDELAALTRRVESGDRDAAVEYLRRLAEGSAADAGTAPAVKLATRPLTRPPTS